MSPYLTELESGIPTGQQISEVGLILMMTGGNKDLIMREDAEFVLNDGILNRIKIKIELNPPPF